MVIAKSLSVDMKVAVKSFQGLLSLPLILDCVTKNVKTKLAASVIKLFQQVSLNFEFKNRKLMFAFIATRLKEHIKGIHSNEPRQFVCEICTKFFATERQLRSHKVYHSEPKYQCKMGCGKKFYRAVLLDCHHKKHLDQKDFICNAPNCGQKYYLKSHLHRHIKAVHEKIK